MLSICVCRCRSSIRLLSIICGRRTATRRNQPRNALLTSSGRDDRISFCSSGRGMILGLERMRSNTRPPITHHTSHANLCWLRLSLIQDTGSKIPLSRIFELRIETGRKANRTSTGSSCAALFVQTSRGNERPPSRKLYELPTRLPER